MSARDAFISPSAAITLRRKQETEGEGRLCEINTNIQRYSISTPYLGSRLTGGLSLGSHRSLELKGQLDVFDLHPLHLDPPVIGGIIQSGLKKTETSV